MMVNFSGCVQNNHYQEKFYFPPDQGKWQSITIHEAGWKKDFLDNALEYARNQNSSGVLILYRGKKLTEKYWKIETDISGRYKGYSQGTTPEGMVIEDVASIQKSIVSLLCGIAQGKGLLDISRPVTHYLGSGWSNAGQEHEQKITVEHLLSMSGGLDHELKYQHPPGKKWLYNTAAYAKLMDILEKISGKSMDRLTKDWLTGPIGAEHSHWLYRKERQNPYRFISTLRDLARTGLLILNEGKWKSNEVIDNPAYLNVAFTPSQNMNRNYGYLFWINTGRKFISSGPEKMIVMFGALNRYVYILPEHDVVAVRLGDMPEKSFNEKFWEYLTKAMP